MKRTLVVNEWSPHYWLKLCNNQMTLLLTKISFPYLNCTVVTVKYEAIDVQLATYIVILIFHIKLDTFKKVAVLEPYRA
jgi:hypothetical protein